MCIVSLRINKDRSFVLTHNRDENIYRTSTQEFVSKRIADIPVHFPQDELSGGSWFMVSEKVGGCILNGEFTKHQRKESYAKSRGKLLLDLLTFDSGKSALEKLSLDGMEAFTLVVVDVENWFFGILVWDEKVKHIQELPSEGSFSVRSSSTLYDSEKKRRHVVALEQHKNSSALEILAKHEELRMRKNSTFPNLQTTSICQWRYTNGKSEWEIRTDFGS